jgi:hypothetical protein
MRTKSTKGDGNGTGFLRKLPFVLYSIWALLAAATSFSATPGMLSGVLVVLAAMPWAYLARVFPWVVENDGRAHVFFWVCIGINACLLYALGWARPASNEVDR